MPKQKMTGIYLCAYVYKERDGLVPVSCIKLTFDDGCNTNDTIIYFSVTL